MYILHLDTNKTPIRICHFIDNTQWSIPIDINNLDYQAYLNWIAAGNTPDVEYVDPFPTSDEPAPEERLAALELVVSMVFGEDDANV